MWIWAMTAMTVSASSQVVIIQPLYDYQSRSIHLPVCIMHGANGAE